MTCAACNRDGCAHPNPVYAGIHPLPTAVAPAPHPGGRTSTDATLTRGGVGGLLFSDRHPSHEGAMQHERR